VFILSFFQNRSFAGMVASKLSDGTREKDIDSLKRFLDNKIVEEKLLEWGYTKEEIASKLNNLSDEDLHFFASRADSLQAGGDAVGAVLGFILALLLIALLVILILELTGHDIVIKAKSRK
jgi:fatty acid-binding protein DegV